MKRYKFYTIGTFIAICLVFVVLYNNVVMPFAVGVVIAQYEFVYWHLSDVFQQLRLAQVKEPHFSKIQLALKKLFKI